MNFEGDLQQIPLWQVLQRVAASQSTGILTVQGQEDIVAISLLRGDVVAADALNQTVEEGLGEALKSQRAITPEDFSAAVRDYQGGSSGSFGDLLIARNLISRDQLLRGLRWQTHRLMLQILGWKSGEFKFYSGDEVSYEQGFQPIAVEELLIRSLEEQSGPDKARRTLPNLDSAYRRLLPRGSVRILGRDGDGSGTGIWLTEAQLSFLEKLDGEKSASKVAESKNLNRYQTQFFLYRLLQEGLIEPTRVVERGPERATERTTSRLEAAELKAEIFLPPEPGRGSRDDLEAKVTVPVLPPSMRWLAPSLAAILAVALLGSVLLRPQQLLLPFPWQAAQREGVERSLRESLFGRLDRVAKSLFLIQAHYPDRLEELVTKGLLSPADLRDPTGQRLAYEADELRYRIIPAETREGEEGFERSEGITGDFLLDPQFNSRDTSDRAPLYLID